MFVPRQGLHAQPTNTPADLMVSLSNHEVRATPGWCPSSPFDKLRTKINGNGLAHLDDRLSPHHA
jgi:hypothetical protein